MRCLLGVSAVLAGLVGGAMVVGVRVNTTPSMPRGLWLERVVPSRLHRGDIVAACVVPSDAVRLYVGAGECQATHLEPVIKQIAAIPGDTVAVTEAGVIVNGDLIRNSARLVVDGKGRSLDGLFPMPVQYEHVVPPGFVWLVAPMDKSFDSRYLGSFPVKSIIGVVEPLLTE